MKQEKQNPNLVILGMHRSGTSMLARELSQLGYHVGEPSELLESQPDNPHGFYERRDVVGFNDELLLAAGGSWANPPEALLEENDTESRVRELVEGLGPGPWLVKDPRMVLTWPCWESALEGTLVIFMYRAASAVAGSLQVRNGFPPDYGLALWELYNRRCLKIAIQRPCIGVCYEDFVSDSVATMAQLRARLLEHGCSLASAGTGSSFDQELNHQRDGGVATSRLMSDEQRLLEQDCALWLKNSDAVGEVEAPSAPLLLRLATQARALQLATTMRELELELDQRVQERDEWRDESRRLREDLDTERSDWQRTFDAQQSEHQALASSYLRLEHDYAALGEQRRDDQRSHVAELAAERQGVFGQLLTFDRSLLGRLFAFLSFIYPWLTLRPARKTPYRELLESARACPDVNRSALAPASRLILLLDVLVYVLRNPAGSIRSMSWPRLWRAISVFFRAPGEDLSLWVGQRFPDPLAVAYAGGDPADDDELDALRLEFPFVEAPKVSIVVPAFNQCRMTLHCLRSLLAHPQSTPFEVILADDCSTDATSTIEQRVSGLILSRPQENRGFVRNCNLAAEQARGDYLLLLNNDTEVTPGWLDALVEVLDRDPLAGVVGPRLLFANGKLQEAGGIVWSDASGWNFGRMDDPDKPQYSYLKRCDYVSGACLLVRTSLWQDLGGFDERYVPAYYEDTDLCFAARSAGYSVFMQPQSQVIHFEGMTNGTDLGSGIKKYQQVNQEKFYAKWKAELSANHFANAEHVYHARDRSRGRRSVLVIDHYVPSFDKDAGSRSTWMYLSLMVKLGYNVKFMGANFFPHQPYTAALQQMGIEVLVGEVIARNLRGWMREHANDIDVVYLHRPHVAEQFLDDLKASMPETRIIYFGHDLHYLRHQREHEVTGDAQAADQSRRWKQREYHVFEQVDQVYYPSQTEIDVVRQEMPGLSARAIPLYALQHETPPIYDAADRKGILFVGGFGHPPNVDSMVWFIEQVMPLVWAQCPLMTVDIVGSNPVAAIKALAGERVTVHGYLSDEALHQAYASAQQVVVPLRFGAGVKGKVIEAIQHGLPTTTTPVGAEGLPEAEAVLNIAEDEDAFAAAVVAVSQERSEFMLKLTAFDAWLETHFSEGKAASILLEDFGEPQGERVCAL